MRRMLLLTLLMITGAAKADPCKGLLPKKGAAFSGIVRYIVDGDGLCIGDNQDPKTWIEVRLADFNAPELHGPGGADARTALSVLAMNKRASCIASHKSYDRVVAACKIGGRPIGALLHERGIEEGGN